uniref:Autophagy-related protein 101 n=1 Tax=Haemonchus contortus TaxID=6289 RepID=W6NGS8_HAECO
MGVMLVKINSDELSNQLEKEIQAFLTELDTTVKASVPRRRTPLSSPTLTETAIPLLGAQISLEFFQRRPRPWPLPVEAVAWERWILFLDIFKANSYDDLARMRVSVAESVGEIVLQLCSSINRPQYLPKMPTRTELSNVFDSNLSDCQPYLFKVCRVPIRPETTSQSGLTGMRSLAGPTPIVRALLCKPSVSGGVIVIGGCELDVPQSSQDPLIPSEYSVTKIIEKRVRDYFNNHGDIELEGFILHYNVSLDGPCPLIYACVATPSFGSERAQEFLCAVKVDFFGLI